MINIDETGRTGSERISSFQALFKENMSRPDIRKTENKPREGTESRPGKRVMVYDIPQAEVKELKLEEYQRRHSKGKENKYKKYIQTEELRRLFKDIL